jgi:CMP-N,N'-diacetyllegionaminic acid synthase
MTRIVALIPARSGSKGVPNKNIRLLGGHSLLEWSIAACLKTPLIDRVIVSTDSGEYADLARKLGAEAPFLRPASISGDRSTDYDFVVHALDWLASEEGEPDFIVHIRPTTPIRDPMVIEAGIREFMAKPHATALRSVHRMPESAYKTFEIAEGGQLKRLGSSDTALDSANNARQQFPDTYQANGYVDVLAPSFIRRAHLIHGDHVIPWITPVVVEVDTEDDFAHLEFQLTQMPQAVQTLFN